MPVTVQVEGEISNIQLRTLIDDLASHYGGSYPERVSSNFLKIVFEDKSKAEAFKRECEKNSLPVKVKIFFQ